MSKRQISLSMENGWAYAGRDGQTCTARPNSQARTETGKINLKCLADHEQDWQPCPVDRYSAESADHTYIVSLSVKTRMVKAEAIEALLYGCSTWTPRQEHYSY